MTIATTRVLATTQTPALELVDSCWLLVAATMLLLLAVTLAAACIGFTSANSFTPPLQLHTCEPCHCVFPRVQTGWARLPLLTGRCMTDCRCCRCPSRLTWRAHAAVQAGRKRLGFLTLQEWHRLLPRDYGQRHARRQPRYRRRLWPAATQFGRTASGGSSSSSTAASTACRC